MQRHLSHRRNSSSLRALTTTPGSSIDFSSNDFLSLSTSPVVRSAYLTELSSSPSFRLGSGGSRLLDGNSVYAENLEEEIAEFHGAEAALLFNSGFDANEGFFESVPQKGDTVVWDEFVHASVRVGMRLSRAESSVSFKHNDFDDLRRVLEKARENGGNVFVAVESLYSMDGDLAPLKEMVEVTEEICTGNGYVVVDEAHSNGVYGERGRGVVCSLGLEARVFARLHTFGKGIGCNGAAILCSKLTREYLINYAKPLIYSTSMSFPSLAAIKVVYSLMKQGATEPLIAHLTAVTAHFYAHLQFLLPFCRHPDSGSQLLYIPNRLPQSPIFALLTPEPRSLAKFCQDGGFMIRPIVPPTVPEGTQRVRVCLHAGNSFEDVERLVARIGKWLKVMRGSERKEEVGLLKASL